jgi:uncharacterized protein (TIGR00369 family)
VLAEVSCIPASDHPGWMEWKIGSEQQFNRYIFQRMLSRMDDPATARIRILPAPEHENVNGVIHGGAILALIDMAIYPATILITGNEELNVVTVDVHTQFITPGDLRQPLDAVITLTQETGRMCFTRGTLLQDDTTVATFNALQRKIR